MTRKDKLREDYEDALFALLMDSYCEEEGRQLLEENERLMADPDFHIPAETEQRCVRTIRRAFARRRRRYAGKSFSRICGKAASVLVLCTLLFSVAYAAIPQVRVGTLNLILEAQKYSTVIRFDGVGSKASEPLANYGYPPVPEGFYLNNQQSFIDRSVIHLIYENDSGDSIAYLTTKISKTTSIDIDTEDAEHGEIEINGRPAYFSTKGNRTLIMVVDEERDAACTVICTGSYSDLAPELASAIRFPGDPAN